MLAGVLFGPQQFRQRPIVRGEGPVQQTGHGVRAHGDRFPEGSFGFRAGDDDAARIEGDRLAVGIQQFADEVLAGALVGVDGQPYGLGVVAAQVIGKEPEQFLA
ncbi:hypothetical protein ACT4S5_09255 [Kocuria oceani]|uniref:hypothetical protein n=1 Tax=Kocuria oceani TaxID=988827 RepID=UPI004036AD9D